MSAQLSRSATAAIITLDNPPVNAISQAMRQGLLDALQQAQKLQDIDRIILTGAGRVFAAGADAREFDQPPLPPDLPDVVIALEQSHLPVIAAINGVALGGGAELLLGCRWRIAAPKVSVGFPEVTLGVVPGAGGTQRLPRLVGVPTALQLVSSGRPLNAEQALAAGLIDQIGDDALEAALQLDLSVTVDRDPLSTLAQPEPDLEAMAEARQVAGKKMRGQKAPLMAIELVGNATTLDFSSAMQAERAAFLQLKTSPQASALRHLFFAERAATRLPSRFTADAEAHLPEHAVVVGGGTMGAGIAYALDSAGIRVTLIESDQTAAERGSQNIASLFDAACRRGLLTREQADDRQTRIRIQDNYKELSDVDIAIEAVFEDLDIKQQIFTRLDESLPTSAVLASNTSYLDINALASVVSEPHRVLGLHFFSPAHIMKLIEVVHAEQTSDASMSVAFKLAKRLAKIPVVSGVCDGFIGNRILMRYREVIDRLLLDGALPSQIDEAMVEFGYPMGPYTMQDMAGLDIAYAERQRRKPFRDPNKLYVDIADRLVEAGCLGKKSESGWYRYEQGKQVIDAEVEALIKQASAEAKITRRPIQSDEIRHRALDAMIDEARIILSEGIAADASDIDLVTVHGYGFPRWRGGLMHYASNRSNTCADNG